MTYQQDVDELASSLQDIAEAVETLSAAMVEMAKTMAAVTEWKRQPLPLDPPSIPAFNSLATNVALTTPSTLAEATAAIRQLTYLGISVADIDYDTVVAHLNRLETSLP